MDWPQKERPLQKKDAEHAVDLSILKWNEFRPVLLREKLEPGRQYQVLEIPLLSLPSVFQEFRSGNFEVATIPFEAFEWLNDHGYRFADFQSSNGRFFYLFDLTESHNEKKQRQNHGGR